MFLRTSVRSVIILLVSVVVAGVPAAATPARADTGVAVDLGRIAVNDGLARGGSYHLPTISVRNPGSEPAVYRMGISYLEGQKERRPVEAWFQFLPREFTLAPGESRPVRVSLVLPTDARAADYAALLTAQTVPEAGGPSVGAAAASQLSFTVKPSTLLEAWTLKGRTWMEHWAPWSYAAPAAVALAAALWWMRTRFSFRLERR